MSAILPPSGRLSLSDLRGVDIQIRNAHLSIILPGAQVAKSVTAPRRPSILSSSLQAIDLTTTALDMHARDLPYK